MLLFYLTQMAKLKILKQGETDITSNDIWRFSVNSDYPSQKVYSSGQTTLTIPAGSNAGSATVNHSLGYAPTIMVMFGESNGRFIKVFGHKAVSNYEQIQQYFLVDISADYIVTYTDLSNPIGSLTNCTVSVNDIIQFQSTTALPSPLQLNTNYYVKGIFSATYPGPKTVNVFTISATQGGAKIDITNSGGANYLAFINKTNPKMGDISGWYGVKSSTTDITFEFFPTLGSGVAGSDINIPIYYIILYEEI